MNKRPKILISKHNPPKTYLKALDLVGLDYGCSFDKISIDTYDGLLIVGGGDIYPFFYDKKIDFSSANLLKDAVEFNLIDFFFKNDLPILGICRGLQLLNVFFGGTLKNVPLHQSPLKTDVYHDLIPPKNGFLKHLTRANSNHKQCTDKLCDKAYDVCFSSDGVVEGFSINKNVFAVQFHPERMGLSSLLSVYGAFANAVCSIKKFKTLSRPF